MSEAVLSAIGQRIMTQHLDLVEKYGVERVVDAMFDEVRAVGEVEEIGQSDISCWCKAIVESLG